MSYRYEKCSIGNIVIKYIVSLYSNIVRGGHFEMYRNTKSLCCITGNNIVL